MRVISQNSPVTECIKKSVRTNRHYSQNGGQRIRFSQNDDIRVFNGLSYLGSLKSILSFDWRGLCRGRETRRLGVICYAQSFNSLGAQQSSPCLNSCTLAEECIKQTRVAVKSELTATCAGFGFEI